MRKLVIALAAAGSALAFASPAAAQYYPAQPYGQAYGYNGYNGGYANYGYGQVQALQTRIDALQNRIRWMDRTNSIRDRSADRLKDEARDIEKHLHRDSRYGLNPYELNSLQTRIARLEQRLQYAGGNRRGGYGHNGYNGYANGQYGDRDRDGRDDRYENDHGYDHDD